MKYPLFTCSLGCLMMLVGCGNKTAKENVFEEDTAAKKMLQGIWLNDDGDDVAFRVKGDTIYYPDSTSLPTYFYIHSDTLVMKGANEVRYPIVKQAAHLLEFKNSNGDLVKLVKTQDTSYLKQFTQDRPVALNQKTLIKRDSIVAVGEKKFHLYVQVNPTSYKVYKRSYNGEGVEVDNVYFDNIINVNIFQGAANLFSRDFHKKDFAKEVPMDFLKQAVLSDMVFQEADSNGISFLAVLAMPDSSLSYQVEVHFSLDGKMTMKIKN